MFLQSQNANLLIGGFLLFTFFCEFTASNRKLKSETEVAAKPKEYNAEGVQLYTCTTLISKPTPFSGNVANDSTASVLRTPGVLLLSCKPSREFSFFSALLLIQEPCLINSTPAWSLLIPHQLRTNYTSDKWHILRQLIIEYTSIQREMTEWADHMDLHWRLRLKSLTVKSLWHGDARHVETQWVSALFQRHRLNW